MMKWLFFERAEKSAGSSVEPMGGTGSHAPSRIAFASV